MRYIVFFILVTLMGSCVGDDVTERMVRDFSITGNDTNVAKIRINGGDSLVLDTVKKRFGGR